MIFWEHDTAWKRSCGIIQSSAEQGQAGSSMEANPLVICVTSGSWENLHLRTVHPSQSHFLAFIRSQIPSDSVKLTAKIRNLAQAMPKAKLPAPGTDFTLYPRPESSHVSWLAEPGREQKPGSSLGTAARSCGLSQWTHTSSQCQSQLGGKHWGRQECPGNSLSAAQGWDEPAGD